MVHGTCQDVTENHRVEDQLRAAEQLFRRAFDDAPIGMALIDLDGRWLRLNRSLCQMLGRSEQQLRTTELNELSHPEDRRLDRPLIKELLAGRRRSFAIEKRYLRADGTMVHALVHISLMHGDGERPLYFLCQLVDITERRRAEAERKASEERLQAIIDNSPALIIVKDTPAPLPAGQPPLGGALRRAGRPGRGAHRRRRRCPPRAGPTTARSTSAWPRTASPTRR